MTKSIIHLLEEIRAIAQLGLNYSRDPYDRERYERLLALASHQYADITHENAEVIITRFRQELGYITPKVGVSAAIFNSKGEILLVKRTDDFTWCLPCGWAEVGETPQESLAREVLEETGLTVEVGDLIRIGSRMPGDFGAPHTSYHLLFHAIVVSGSLKDSFETSNVNFYSASEVRRWHLDHEIEVQSAIQYMHSMT
ncbi:MAG: NUDIX hydrolase [Aquirhabdus sp.]